jgi:hypothetical protein
MERFNHRVKQDFFGEKHTNVVVMEMTKTIPLHEGDAMNQMKKRRQHDESKQIPSLPCKNGKP